VSDKWKWSYKITFWMIQRMATKNLREKISPKGARIDNTRKEKEGKMEN
jgi:hypothetical protein